jgi:hypothetical protein
MNKPEALAIMARLSIAYPEHKMPDAAVDLWVEDILRYDYAVAVEAVEQWRKSQQWFPKTSQLLGACDAIERRQEVGPFPYAELGAAPSTKSGKEWIEEIRAKIATAQPWRQDPKTGEKVLLPRVAGFKTFAQSYQPPREPKAAKKKPEAIVIRYDQQHFEGKSDPIDVKP